MYSRVPPLPDIVGNSSDSESNDGNKPETEPVPKHVPQALWEKFKLLEKRTDDVTRRSTEKRIKHLQKSVITKVQEEITTNEDRDILVEHDVKFGPPVKDQPKRKRKRDNNHKEPLDGELASNSEWSEVKSFLTAKDHMKGTDPGKYAPKSGLEKTIDSAIAEGDFDKAEELSDRLANRQFGTKIADAIDARNYSKIKEEEKQSAKAKKKRKLPWGFEHKQRWETKSNM